MHNRAACVSAPASRRTGTRTHLCSQLQVARLIEHLVIRHLLRVIRVNPHRITELCLVGYVQTAGLLKSVFYSFIFHISCFSPLPSVLSGRETLFLV